MIRRRVSAVLRLRDGFTGRVLPGGAVCLLDGRPLRHPLWKEGGYLVIQDLAAGPHSLEVRCAGFRPVTLTVDMWKIFNEPYILPGPGTSNTSLFQYMYESGFNVFNMGYASAIGVFLMFVLTVISIVQFCIRKRQGEI